VLAVEGSRDDGGIGPTDRIDRHREGHLVVLLDVPAVQLQRELPTLRGNALLVEQVNTTLLLSAAHDCVCDDRGSFVAYRKGREERLPDALQELIP
jgi:hypothetical protein